MSLEARLKAFAREIGIDVVGITTAEPFLDAKSRLLKMRELGYLSPWAEPDLDLRTNPRLLMADAESLIAVGMVLPGQTQRREVARWWGKLARFARYQDYHSVLRTKMEELVEWLRKEYPGLQAEIYVDTGPLLDREVAFRAGLGFFGQNAALIHPELGSFLALGEILTNLTLKPDLPLTATCGDCRLCLDACPQGAITGPGEIDTTRCLAHFTQEKGMLPTEVQDRLGTRLWGCDTCQDVCPYNKNAGKNRAESRSTLWIEHGLGGEPDLEEILSLTNREYRERVGTSAMAWRGKTTLQRNALINLGNLCTNEAIPVLLAALKDERAVIRAAAVHALAKLKSPDVIEFLQIEARQESDADVQKLYAEILRDRLR